MTSQNITPVILSQPPSTVCSGFIDQHGIWNNGFACPIQNSVQYFCCMKENYHYCCSPDSFIEEKTSSLDDGNLISPSDLFNGRSSRSNHSNRIDQQFEQFQKAFLPIFLLTSSILFLVGIAIWFGLYKQKAFYATQDERNQFVSRTVPCTRRDLMNQKKKRANINLTLEQSSQAMLFPSTEV